MVGEWDIWPRLIDSGIAVIMMLAVFALIIRSPLLIDKFAAYKRERDEERERERKFERQALEQSTMAIDALRKSHERMENIVDKALATHHATEERYARMEKRVLDLEPLREEVETLRAENAKLSDRVVELEGMEEARLARIAALEADQKRLRGKIAKIEKERDEVSKQRDDAERRVVELEEQVKELHGEIGSFRKRLNDADAAQDCDDAEPEAKADDAKE